MLEGVEEGTCSTGTFCCSMTRRRQGCATPYSPWKTIVSSSDTSGKGVRSMNSQGLERGLRRGLAWAT